MTIGFNKKRDTMEVFNENWKVNHENPETYQKNPVLNNKETKPIIQNRFTGLKKTSSNLPNSRFINHGK